MDENFFFQFYSIYQNGQPSHFKIAYQKISETSGIVTILVYFCNHQPCIMVTKVKQYCDFTWSHRNFLMWYLSVNICVHFDIWNKNWKIFPSIFDFTIPPIVIFSKIGLKSKSGFVWTFFQKTKWTHVSVKNLDLQVSNPKNIATVKVYFSSFPYGTPCSSA